MKERIAKELANRFGINDDDILKDYGPLMSDLKKIGYSENDIKYELFWRIYLQIEGGRTIEL